MGAPPVIPLDKFDRKRRGSTYATWFKAVGALEESEIGSSPVLIVEGDFELVDSLPSPMYSQVYLGYVKRDRVIVPREDVIADLNTKAPWSPYDFRDLYPIWEYVYQVREYIGGVLLGIFEHKAKYPRDRKDIRRGWLAN